MIMKKVQFLDGHYIFKLDDLLKNYNVSINKLSRETNTDFTVIKRYLEPDESSIVRLDLFVIARFCNYFHCPMDDIIVYINNKN